MRSASPFRSIRDGVKLYARRAYPLQATGVEDYPLTSRFDETDCFVVLDNVFVPWERVFIYRNIEVCFAQWWKTPAHLYGNHQAQARYATKLRFLLGLAKRMNEATGNDRVPPVQVEMGELAAYASIVEHMLQSHETVSPIDEDGILWPSKTALYAVMALQSRINPHMIDIVRELTGAAMISLPSSSQGLRQSGGRRRHRALFRVGRHGRARAHRADAAGMGFHRHRVRQPPPAIREVLRRRGLSGENEHVPLLRFRAGNRHGRSALDLPASDA